MRTQILATITSAARGGNAPAFARIAFNQALKVRSCYSQFNFDDPWVFPMRISNRRIVRPSGTDGQVPDFKSLGKQLPHSYNYPLTKA